tara:strand:+ start:2245 stop:2490 length:246 start_codon:yes stop_codon:yes gene_type:complete
MFVHGENAKKILQKFVQAVTPWRGTPEKIKAMADAGNASAEAHKSTGPNILDSGSRWLAAILSMPAIQYNLILTKRAKIHA